MEIQELRIGNWIESENDFFQIETLQSQNYWKFNGNIKNDIEIDFIDQNKNTYWCELKDINPIPITEEWLLRFGFEKKEKSNLYLISIHEFNLKKLCVYLDINNCTIAMVDYFSNLEKTELFPLNYKYIHQLQNLFYSITQTELQCKVETNGSTLE